MTWEILSKLRTDLTQNIGSFKEMLSNNVNNDVDSLKLTVKEYERRINVSLELQYLASYIVSILYQMISTIKYHMKKGGNVKEQLQIKDTYEELNTLLEEYKAHVYNYSQRAKCLADTLKIKQMANPDCFRG